MLLNKQISISYFLNLIKWDIVAIAIYAIIAGFLDHYGVLRRITIPLAISSLVATIVSLLLAFRTSQSYERWWEARLIWGAIVNDSRTLIRQVKTFLPEEATAFAHRQIIWCYALSESLRGLPFSEKIKVYISAYHTDSRNWPNFLLNEHAKALAAAHDLNPNRQVQIDATLARLCDAMGKCERIKKTVFPKSYSLLIHFLIYVLMTILPFGLEDRTQWMEIVIVFVVPVLFIAIERTAIIMQDPFENKPTDTPMTAISQTIEVNLLEMIGEPAPEQAVGEDTYYLM
ncbi:bestrophin family ion channel [Chitinophaga sp.]|uniref:bestrophin family protein n=1 Tax=Chitinophaga sp. TaxID=1869181 RepID=UPI0031D7556F